MTVAPVLDASAFLAYLRDEPGAELVAALIGDGASISTVNLAEALATATAHGAEPAALVSELTARGLLDGVVTVEPFIAADALEAARLRPLARASGLSLGDRACLALARRLGAAAITADSAWNSLRVDVEVRQIR